MSDSGPVDIVSVYVCARRARAECSCGWQARRRLLRSVAVVDACLHAYDTDHTTGWPLIIQSEWQAS